ncbi:MAG: hypothetical protein J6M05_01205 [Cardiobacteriaceae bacterium]|nr:hypothetical protein [Cardiobacteriaceae bacterium]
MSEEQITNNGKSKENTPHKLPIISASSKALFLKELYQFFSPLAVFSLAGIWLFWGICFFVFFEQYQALAAKLAMLENRRGATQMLLVTANNLLMWLLVAWVIFFASKTVATEFEQQTFRLLPRHLGGFVRSLKYKFLVILLSIALLVLPFWLAVFALSFATDWDLGQVFGIFLTQVLFAVYAASSAILAALFLRQGVASALFLALFWLLLYVLPLIIYEPASLAAVVQWFSPFSHAQLLSAGIFHIQTLTFILLNAFFFISLTLLVDWEAR